MKTIGFIRFLMFSLVWGACLALPNRVVLNHAKTWHNIGKPMVVDICARDVCDAMSARKTL